MNSQQSSVQRRELERKAKAAIELKSRRTTRYGLLCPDSGHVTTLQRDNKNRQIWNRDVSEAPDIWIPAKFDRWLTTQKRNKGVYGGRGSAKTESVCRISLAESKDMGYSNGCFREFQNSIDDSILSNLARLVPEIGAYAFDVQAKKILGTKKEFDFTFKGLARNIESVKGMTDYDRFIYEEAATLSEESLQTSGKTLRKPGSEHWYIFNPQASTDPLSQKLIIPFQSELDEFGFYEDDDYLIMKLNWSDNPWFQNTPLAQDRLNDFRDLPRAVYDHIWEGAFNDSVENAIIPAEWFDACIDAHLVKGFKPSGIKVVSHDPSDLNEGSNSANVNDPRALAYRHGSVILDVVENKEDDVNDACDWALDFAIGAGADGFIWDCVGIGLSLKRQVSQSLEGKRIVAEMFGGGDSVDFPRNIYEATDTTEFRSPKSNKETFVNKRAQYYWMLRDRVYNTYRAVVHNEYINPDDMISFSSGIKNLQKLRSEVCRIPRKPNGNGKIQMLSKDEMKNKLKIASPNMADCVMMSLAMNGMSRAVKRQESTNIPQRQRVR